MSKNEKKCAKATCVQCHRNMDYCLDDNSLKGRVFVCHYPDCPNYGLLAICEEKMPEE